MMKALIGTRADHYERLGLIPGIIQHWEDGLRTGAADGTFEWWYFDVHLDDGSTLTVEFHTKPPYVSPSAPLTPFVLLTYTRPDGSRTDRTCTAEPSDFAAAKHTCDVTIGASTFRQVEYGYAIHVELEDVVADIELRSQVPPWRPETGHAFFGDDEQRYIAWLPVVTRGEVQATLTIDGRSRQLTGSGYHDHNWGNIAPRKVLDHWYWGRACIGDYTIVTLMFLSADRYGRQTLPAFMVAKSGEILTSSVGAAGITFTETDTSFHPTTGVPVARRLEYTTENDATTYTVAFQHRDDAFHLDFGPAGAYHRFLGDVTITLTRDGHSESLHGQTLWELLYFGTLRAQPPDQAAHGEAGVPVIGHQA